MRKVLKLLIVVLLILSFHVAYCAEFEYTNENTNYKLLIEDDAMLLNAEDIDGLISDMMPLTEYGNIAFKSIDINSSTAESFAKSFYNNKFGSKSGSVFLIDMDNRMIYIFSDGFNYSVITKSKANIITDNVYRYATNKEYYACASNVYSQMNTLLEGGKILEPMRYTSNVLISTVCGFFITFFTVIASTMVKSASNDKVLKGCDIYVKVKNIIATKTGQHREYSPRSSSSGGGGHSSGRRRTFFWWWRWP